MHALCAHAQIYSKYKTHCPVLSCNVSISKSKQHTRRVRSVMTDGDTSLWLWLVGIVAAVGVCCCLLAQPTPQWLYLVQHRMEVWVGGGVWPRPHDRRK